ncbi:MAG TPA: DUF433 domain-containing protein [Blastocatellia bacterium]
MQESDIVLQDGCYRLAGTRVSLDSLVYLFLEGLSPESMLSSFPTLTIEQVDGAIAFYFSHKEEVDAHLRDEDADFERRRLASREANPGLYTDAFKLSARPERRPSAEPT